MLLCYTLPYKADKSNSIAGAVQGRDKIFKTTVFFTANQGGFLAHSSQILHIGRQNYNIVRDDWSFQCKINIVLIKYRNNAIYICGRYKEILRISNEEACVIFRTRADKDIFGKLFTG